MDSEAVVEYIWDINEVNSKDMSTGSVSQELFQTILGICMLKLDRIEIVSL